MQRIHESRRDTTVLCRENTQLCSLTKGRAACPVASAKCCGTGVPNLEFSHYAIVPKNVADEIIAARK